MQISSKLQTKLIPTEDTAISIIGMGYVGLATAVCFANAGYRVFGVENDQEKVNVILSGKSPLHEDKIDSLLAGSVRTGRFSISSDIEESIKSSSITFITVGTPSKADGNIELSYLRSAVSAVGKEVGSKVGYHLVVIKSTVVPGTTSRLVLPNLRASTGKSFPRDFGLCFNPEFLREGSAIKDTLRPDALIIGSEDEDSSKILHLLYKLFYREKLPFTMFASTSNAEFIKYAVNTFRATQLSYLNSIATLCERIPGTDIEEVTKGLSAVTKIDKRYLKSGLGFGGSCLPKDLRALVCTFRNFGIEPTLLMSTLAVNSVQPTRVIEIAREVLGELSGRRVSVLGLTFKAGTDDVRESVGLQIANYLVSSGARARVYDPRGMENAKRVLGKSVTYAQTPELCIKDADCCIIATEWKEFKKISPSSFVALMRNPVIIDGWRVLDYELFKSQKVTLIQLGRFQYSPETSLKVKIESMQNKEAG